MEDEYKGNAHALSLHFYDTFGFLITQDYYENMGAGEGVYGRDTMRLIALSVFSFLVLNFLIGVITEAYDVEKGKVGPRLWSLRANGCASYFARMRLLHKGMTTVQAGMLQGSVACFLTSAVTRWLSSSRNLIRNQG